MPNPNLTLKERLYLGETVVGSWITLGHPAIAEIFSKAGFDWIAVDLEHSAMDLREAEDLIRIIDLSGSVPLVRLTSNHPDQIKRILDSGAHGVIVPAVNTREAAESAVSAVYYPPHGRRGVGLSRAQGYGTSFQSDCDWFRKNALTIVMIEDIKAVENIDAILSVSGVDGYFLGPYDLSASMGKSGQFQDVGVQEAISHVRLAGKKLGKPGGIHIVEPDPEQLQQRIAEGFTFLCYSLDTRMLDVMSRTTLAMLGK